jgi:hypothetical protein
MFTSFDFVNPGIRFLGKNEHFKSKLDGIVICGLPRSGTTALAAGFQNAGFNLGVGLSNVVEDQRFRNALTAQDPSVLNQYFQARKENSSDLPFCVKYPDAYQSISLISKTAPNVCILISTRDPFCIAMRNNISMFADFKTFFRKSINDYTKMHNNIMDNIESANTILVSYEKLLSSPLITFENLFSLLLPNECNINEMASLASRAIEINSKGYLEESNIRPDYSVDAFNPMLISGYCFFKSAPNRIVELEVLLNDVVIQTVRCDIFREDMSTIHPSGLCGFEFNPSESLGHPDSNVSLRIKGTSHIIRKESLT